MRRYLSIWTVLIIAVVVHLDWHFGRSHHHRLSLSLSYHWMLGLVTFFLLVLFCARKWPRNTVRAVLLNGTLGLLMGQIIEPLVEVAAYRFPISDVLTNERWRVFAEFAVASVIGIAAGLILVRVRGRRDPQPA